MSTKLKNTKCDIENSQDSVSLAKRVQSQQHKLTSNNLKLNVLEQKVSKLKEQKKKKQQIISELNKGIKKLKQKQNPILKQLRQHYKVLKQELNMAMDEDEEEVDVDSMTYEELLELGEKIGKVSKAVSQEKLQNLETFKYEKQHIEECSICRDQFEENTQCIRLKCKHFFHADCVKEWLKMEKICPYCKTEL